MFATRVYLPPFDKCDMLKLVRKGDAVQIYVPRRSHDPDLELHVAAFLRQCGYMAASVRKRVIRVSQKGCATSVLEVEASLWQWATLTRGG